MENNVMNENLIVALDIGTTKICAIVARCDDEGRFEILGIGKADSKGLNRGVIHNIEQTVQGIRRAISEAEMASGISVERVYVGIAGAHIDSLQHRGYIFRENNDTDEISQKDIDRLVQDMYKLVVPPGNKIIHVLPQEYIVDNEMGIKDPIGMSGRRLEADFHIITGQIAATENIFRCVEKSGFEVAGLILEPLASSAAVLIPEEKEAGVALVDIGGGTTDLAIFKDGIIRHTAVIPFGGNIVTEDIKEGCQVMKPQAELMKIRFGSALAADFMENEIISIPSVIKGRDHKEISVKNLAHIIQARMEEIIESVYCEIRNSGYENKLIMGVVVTGGGAQLKNLKHLIEYITGMDARVGVPMDQLANKSHKMLQMPMYATTIGLLTEGNRLEKKYAVPIESRKVAKEEESKQPSFWDKIRTTTLRVLEGDGDEIDFK